MHQHERVILLEFNELSPALMDRFLNQGKLPGFARLRRESLVWTTDAEEKQEELEPWIQWVTVHTGLSYAEHGVFRLDEAADCPAPRLWDLVSQAGGRSWVCGSMNAAYRDDLDGYVLPDPWATGVAARPADVFEPYIKFVRAHVQEYTNDRVPLGPVDYARFAAFMATHGLSLDTATSIARQLAAERRQDARWRRAVILDRLQWDVFRHYYDKLRPALSTFFLNSTAHLQHAYWRNLEPDAFESRPSAAEQAVYGDAVEFGFRQMDALVSECIELAGHEATIVFATALGQQPCRTYEATGGKRFYRPREMDALLRFAGVEGVRPAPVMSEQFHLRADDEEAAERVAARLEQLRVDGEPAMTVERKGRNVFAGCGIYTHVPDDARLEGPEGATRFFDVFYRADVTKSGMHHPDGMLWIRRPSRVHRAHPEKASIRAIAPTVLDVLGIEQPEAMRASSLLS